MNLFLAEDGRLRSGWRFLLSIFVFFVASWAAGEIGFRLVGNHPRVQDAIFRIVWTVLLLLGFSLLLKFADRVPENPLPAMGLSRRGAVSQSGHGLVLGTTMVLLAYGVMAVWLPLNLSLRITSRTLEVAALEFFVLLAAAMAEEVSFRGYPFQRLVEGLGPYAATGIFALLFGIVHLQNPHASFIGFVNTVAISFVLAIAYLRTGALWLPWGIHFGWNFALGMVLGMPVSGIRNFAVLVRGNIQGPDWLTGGSYGLEGGAMGTVVILLGMAYLTLVAKPKPISYSGSMSSNGMESAGHPDLRQSIQ